MPVVAHDAHSTHQEGLGSVDAFESLQMERMGVHGVGNTSLACNAAGPQCKALAAFLRTPATRALSMSRCNALLGDAHQTACRSKYSCNNAGSCTREVMAPEYSIEPVFGRNARSRSSPSSRSCMAAMVQVFREKKAFQSLAWPPSPCSLADIWFWNVHTSSAKPAWSAVTKLK